MIGLSVSLLLLTTGRVAGISGIVGGLFTPVPGEAMAMTLVRSPGALVIGGLLVGVGTQLGGGCTSGHGVCGISRMSQRSLVATIVFMAFGMLTTWVVNHGLGGAL